MFSLTVAAVLQASLISAAPQTYSEAFHVNAETGRPLVVLVGADWCPACRTMKTSTMPSVARSGLLDKVAFAVVDTDREGDLARKLMSGGSIPQLIMYHQTPEGWKREMLLGGQSPSQVESFIRRGLDAPTNAIGSR